jgi:hypothetical protein
MNKVEKTVTDTVTNVIKTKHNPAPHIYGYLVSPCFGDYEYLPKAPKGLVIPTQEKNLHIKLDDTRLRALEGCRVF